MNKPLIGLLCIDRKDSMSPDICSYIDEKNVKYLEDAGAGVVPIWINRTADYYEDILSKVNGVLLPGGAVYVNEHDPARLDLTNYCVTATLNIIRIAEKLHKKGINLPIWGTCLGFQLLVLYTTHLADAPYGTDVRDKCEFMNCFLSVEFSSDFRDSRLFADLPVEIESIMKNKPFGHHRHRYCVSLKTAESFNDVWHILAKNEDAKGLEFASIIEHRRYPFFGSQFHPESECSPECNKVKEFLARFFVDQCRSCGNRFESDKDERRHLIQNFPVTISGKSTVRVFGDSVDYRKNENLQIFPLKSL
ncbi:gamma-glutamyl hydrolase [Bactrocera dorsalis]|uniref:folate gamma-glutamyl hydrolase n=1 Tax=Bactrocera dorsalis TaxID=27457 RepID=A0ABM3JXB8_BACDO|nr:gamma-glutamyl hydrolase [Bactrocera dorsalis]XP_049313878.1 gamma-glutamyl hydrolase [Bactrocera dorsalis]